MQKFEALSKEEKRARVLKLDDDSAEQFSKMYLEWKGKQVQSHVPPAPAPPPPPKEVVNFEGKPHSFEGSYMSTAEGALKALVLTGKFVATGGLSGLNTQTVRDLQWSARRAAIEPTIAMNKALGMGQSGEYLMRSGLQWAGGSALLDTMSPDDQSNAIKGIEDFYRSPTGKTLTQSLKFAANNPGGVSPLTVVNTGAKVLTGGLAPGIKLPSNTDVFKKVTGTDLEDVNNQVAGTQAAAEGYSKLPLYMLPTGLVKLAPLEEAGIGSLSIAKNVVNTAVHAVSDIAGGAVNAAAGNVLAAVPEQASQTAEPNEKGERVSQSLFHAGVGGAVFGTAMHAAPWAGRAIAHVVGVDKLQFSSLLSKLFANKPEVSSVVTPEAPAPVLSEAVPEAAPSAGAPLEKTFVPKGLPSEKTQVNDREVDIRAKYDKLPDPEAQPLGAVTKKADSAFSGAKSFAPDSKVSVFKADGPRATREMRRGVLQPKRVTVQDIAPSMATVGQNDKGESVVRYTKWLPDATPGTHPQVEESLSSFADLMRLRKNLDKHGIDVTCAAGPDAPGQRIGFMEEQAMLIADAPTKTTYDPGTKQRLRTGLDNMSEESFNIRRAEYEREPVKTYVDDHVVQDQGVVLISPDGVAHPYRFRSPRLREHAFEASNLFVVTRQNGDKQYAYHVGSATTADGTQSRAFHPLDEAEGIANTPERVLSGHDITKANRVTRGSPEMRAILAESPAPHDAPSLNQSLPATSLAELKTHTRAAVKADPEAQKLVAGWAKPAKSMEEFNAQSALLNEFARQHGVPPDLAHILLRDAAESLGIKTVPKGRVSRPAPVAPEESVFQKVDVKPPDAEDPVNGWQEQMNDGDPGRPAKAWKATNINKEHAANARRAVGLQKQLTKLEVKYGDEAKKTAAYKKLKAEADGLSDAKEHFDSSLKDPRNSEAQSRNAASKAKENATKAALKEQVKPQSEHDDEVFARFAAERDAKTPPPAPEPLADPAPYRGSSPPKFFERPAGWDEMPPAQRSELLRQVTADVAYASAFDQAEARKGSGTNAPASRAAYVVAREAGVPEKELVALHQQASTGQLPPPANVPPSPAVQTVITPPPPPAPPPAPPFGPPPPAPPANSPNMPPSGNTPPQIPPGGVNTATLQALSFGEKQYGIINRALRTVFSDTHNIGGRSVAAANFNLRKKGAEGVGKELELQVRDALQKAFGNRGIEFREAVHSAYVSKDIDAVQKVIDDPKWNIKNKEEVGFLIEMYKQHRNEMQDFFSANGAIAPVDVSDGELAWWSSRVYLSKNAKPGTVLELNRRNPTAMAFLDKTIEDLGRQGKAFVPPASHLKPANAKDYADWRKGQLEAFMSGPEAKEYRKSMGSGQSPNTSLLPRLKLLDDHPILRWALGESHDAMLTIPQDMVRMQALKVQLDMMNELTNMGEHIEGGACFYPESQPPPPELRTESSNLLGQYVDGTRRIWAQLPKQAQYGKAAGGWVRHDVYDTMFQAPNAGVNIPRWMRALTGTWKQNTVLANPGTYWNNIMSNMQGHVLSGSFNPFTADVAATRSLFEASSHFREWNKAPLLDATEGARFQREARELNVISAGFHGSEGAIQRRVIEDIHEHFRAHQGLSLPDTLTSLYDTLNNKPVQYVGGLLDHIDQWNKYSAFLTLRRRGVSAMDAAQRVNVSFPSYNAVPNWVKSMRGVAPNPFITTTSQMIEKYALIPKRATEGMAGEPGGQFAARMGGAATVLGLLGYGANRIRRMELGMSDEELALSNSNLSTQTTGYRPGMLAMYRRQAAGEQEPNVMYIDFTSMFEPLAWLRGNPKSNPFLRIAYNTTVGAVADGPLTQDLLNDGTNALFSGMGLESPTLPSTRLGQPHIWQRDPTSVVFRAAQGGLTAPGAVGMATAFGARTLNTIGSGLDDRPTVFQRSGRLSDNEMAAKIAGIKLVPGVLNSQVQKQDANDLFNLRKERKAANSVRTGHKLGDPTQVERNQMLDKALEKKSEEVRQRDVLRAAAAAHKGYQP
jgi:hypothetical protein